jgi:hypothetical protein
VHKKNAVRAAAVTVGTALALLMATLVAPAASAHQNGCHRYHSCPSDTGSYTCGDLGYYTYCGYGPPTAPAPAPTATRTPSPSAAPPSPTPTAPAAGGCDPHYPDFCLPPAPDVDCGSSAVAGRNNFTALEPDPHGLDADSDGVACEAGSGSDGTGGGTGGTGGTGAAPASGPADGSYTGLSPTRIVDTRTGTGGLRRFGPGQAQDVQATGVAGIPATGVLAVVLNTTAVRPSAGGHLSLWPAGTARPATSNVNFAAGGIVPNLVTVPVGAGGKVSVLNSAGSTDVLIDAVGFYAAADGPAGSLLRPLAPARILDTRTTGPVGPGQTRSVRVAGTGGIPATGAVSVVVNLTATRPTAAGHLAVFPGGDPVPGASNVNFAARQTVANTAIVPVGPDGAIDVHNSAGTTDVLVDVVAYYAATGARFVPSVPRRLLDTRDGGTAFGDGEQRAVRLDSSSGVVAGVLNLTATQPTTAGYLTAFPTGAARPATSSVNFTAGRTASNAAVVGATNGQTALVNAGGGRTHVLVDLFGVFVASAPPAAAALGPSSSATAQATPSPTSSASSPPAVPAALSGLRIAPHDTAAAYDRAAWPHWDDADGDCQDTRAEVLVNESYRTVSWDPAGCAVLAGEWLDRYTGQRWTSASDMDVEHLVALHNAHLSGGARWDASRKRAFANDLADPSHLVAVKDTVNQSKGSSGPEAWKPPLASAWCAFATDWARVKQRWDLTVTQAEHDALRDMLATC